MKKLKHARRKVTQAQVDAMNRELELWDRSWRYAVDEDGRLIKQEVMDYYNW